VVQLSGLVCQAEGAAELGQHISQHAHHDDADQN
jgi:hypothetical protein